MGSVNREGLYSLLNTSNLSNADASFASSGGSSPAPPPGRLRPYHAFASGLNRLDHSSGAIGNLSSSTSGSSPVPPPGRLRPYHAFASGLNRLDDSSGPVGGLASSSSPTPGSSPAPSPGCLRTCRVFASGLNRLDDSSGPVGGIATSSDNSSPIPGGVRPCTNTASGPKSGKSLEVRSSFSAPLLGQSFPSRAQSLPAPQPPGPHAPPRQNVSAPQPQVHTFNLTPDASASSYANVVLNFNYGVGAEWGQAKRLPRQQFGASPDSADITPSFKLHPDLHSTPVHPMDPNKTPSSLFDSQPSSDDYWQISRSVKHMFDSRLLGPSEPSSYLTPPKFQTEHVVPSPPPGPPHVPAISAHCSTLSCVPVEDAKIPSPQIANTTYNVPTGRTCNNVSPDKPFIVSGNSTFNASGNRTYIISGSPVQVPDSSFHGDTGYATDLAASNRPQPVNRKLNFDDSSASGAANESSFAPLGNDSPLNLSVSTANAVMDVVDNITTQEREFTVQGLRNFQQSRRKVLSKTI